MISTSCACCRVTVKEVFLVTSGEGHSVGTCVLIISLLLKGTNHNHALLFLNPFSTTLLLCLMIYSFLQKSAVPLEPSVLAMENNDFPR